MGDSLDELDLPSAADVGAPTASTERAIVARTAPPAKGGFKEFAKFVGISFGAFIVVGNPYTALGLSKIPGLNTPMKIYAAQAVTFLLVVAGAKWYLG